MCCGMGGSYSLKLPEISAPILERKLTNIKNTGAPLVVMDCPGCVMQIRGGLDKQTLNHQGRAHGAATGGRTGINRRSAGRPAGAGSGLWLFFI